MERTGPGPEHPDSDSGSDTDSNADSGSGAEAVIPGTSGPALLELMGMDEAQLAPLPAYGHHGTLKRRGRRPEADLPCLMKG